MKDNNQHSSNAVGARGIILFDRGRSVPRADTGLFVALIGEKLFRERNAKVHVIGHANLRETPRTAEVLGLKRANRVASALIAFGARVDQLHVGSAGARAPMTMPNGRAEPTLGRRVEIVWDASNKK